MKITKEDFILAIITLIAIHLLICNTKLLWIADNAQGIMRILWGLVGLSYSVLSAMSVAKINKIGYVIPFALLDSCGVLIEKYNYDTLIGWYFAVYTLVAIILSWLAIHKGFEEKATALEPTQQRTETKPEIQRPALEQPKTIAAIPANTDNQLSSEQQEQVNALTKKLNPSGLENRTKIISEVEDVVVKEYLTQKYLSNDRD